MQESDTYLIVRSNPRALMTSAIKQTIKDGTITLRQIEVQREKLEAQRAELEARIAELNTIEEQAVKQQKAKPNRRQPVDTKGYVYLLQTTVGYWKIGRTRNPDNRLKTFSVKLPFPVEYAHLIQCDDMYTAEDQLHRQFAAKRVNGSEFFALDEQDVDYIKSLATL